MILRCEECDGFTENDDALCDGCAQWLQAVALEVRAIPDPESPLDAGSRLD